MLLQFPGRLDLVRERVGHASLCPSSWSPLLGVIEKVLPGVETRLRRIDRDVARRSFKVHRATSVANRTRLRYSDSGWQDDCYPSLEPGTIFRFDDPDGAAQQAQQEFSAEGGPIDAGLILHDCAQQSWSLTMTAPRERRDAVLPAVLTLLRRLAGDLVDAFVVSHAIGSPDQPSRDRIESTWDPLCTPVLLLDRELVISAANAAAEDLLREARYFRPRFFDDHLALANRNDGQLLEATVNRLLAGRRASARVSLEGLRRSAPLSATLRRAGSPDWRRQFTPELAETAHVLAVFRLPEDPAVAASAQG